MSVFVDPLGDFGWKLYGRPTQNCHLFTDELDFESLHTLAEQIGMKRAWFQDKDTPYYDLTPKRRVAAVKAGAIELDRTKAVSIWQTRRALARGLQQQKGEKQ